MEKNSYTKEILTNNTFKINLTPHFIQNFEDKGSKLELLVKRYVNKYLIFVSKDGKMGYAMAGCVSGEEFSEIAGTEATYDVTTLLGDRKNELMDIFMRNLMESVHKETQNKVKITKKGVACTSIVLWSSLILKSGDKESMVIMKELSRIITKEIVDTF